MNTFLLETLFAIGMLMGLGLAGGFVVLPLRKRLPFALLTAPLAGLLCISLALAAFYTLAGWSFGKCVIAGTIACWGATLVGLIQTRPTISWNQLSWMAVLVVIVAAIAVRTSEAATIHFHGPGLLYCDGTDALGYAQMADWVRSHTVMEAPDTFTRVPYQAYLAYLFRVDTRFGSFFFVALVGLLRHVPGAFAYDATTAVVLAASILAVAAAFARSRAMLLLLIVGLTCSHWYEYGRTGFLGKEIAYPAVLLLLALYFAIPEAASLGLICILAIVVCAVALMHSGSATALFLAASIGPYLAARYVWERKSDANAYDLRHRALAAVILIGMPILASGVIARPVKLAMQDWHLTWSYVLPRVLDLEHHGATIAGLDADPLRPPLILGHQGNPVSGMGPHALAVATGAGAFLWLFLLVLSIRRRNPVALGLLLGPALILLAFRVANSPVAAFQLVGFTYPFILCGGAALVRREDRPGGHDRDRLVFLILILSIALRVPRYAGSVWRYAGSAAPKMQRFSLVQTRRLAHAIGNRPVEVDMGSATHAIFVLVELGRRDVELQWTPQSWYTVLSYTHWPTPSYPPARLKLQIATGPVPPGYKVICRAMPFRLIERRDNVP